MTRKSLRQFQTACFLANFSGKGGFKRTFVHFDCVGFRGLMAYADVSHVCSSGFDSQLLYMPFSLVSYFFLSSFLSFFFFLFFFFLSRLISYCWLFPWPARKVSIQRSHVKTRERSTRVRRAGKEGEPPPLAATSLARAF